MKDVLASHELARMVLPYCRRSIFLLLWCAAAAAVMQFPKANNAFLVVGDFVAVDSLTTSIQNGIGVIVEE